MSGLFFEAQITFLAGLVSVLSPCVLPVLPIILTGSQDEHRARPLLIVLGLAITFVAMGAVSALFGSLVAPLMPDIEQGAGLLIILFGSLMLAGLNPFKRLGFLSNLPFQDSGGRWSGLVLGMTLGLIWIPCVGPVLSAVLARVAGHGDPGFGMALLSIYATGFSLPMLAVAYLSHGLRRYLNTIMRHPAALRWISGSLLIAFGTVVTSHGMLAFSF